MADREALPIRHSELLEHAQRASSLLTAVKWTAKPAVLSSPGDKPATGAPAWREVRASTARDEELSIFKSAKRISADPLLLAEEINYALTVLRRAIQIGVHLSKLYTRASNLDSLIDQNGKGLLSGNALSEFRAKYQTASAISIFVLAYHVVHELQGYKIEQVGKAKTEYTGIPEVNLRGPVDAINCALFYFAAYLEKTDVKTPYEFVRMALEYFKGIIDELELKSKSFEFTEPFTQRTYVLEDSDFVIDGFKAELNGGVASVEFNRTDVSTIVGNRDAKHYARRLAERIVCFRPETKRNIMFELGGFPEISLGYGEPGTGKSLLIAATATMIHDLCQMLGLPFRFHPMPDTIISTFQGGSGERMYEWMRHLSDPAWVTYAPIDDAENNLEERTRQGVSAGVREVIACFLRNTEGAYAKKYGNSAIGIYTNIPEQIDRAVMSRVIGRAYIGGAIDPKDFIDQDYLWWKRYRELDSTFINMEDPQGYVYLESQRLVGSLLQIQEAITEPRDERVREVFHKVSKDHRREEHAFFGAFFAGVKKVFPFFTSRDLRNIQRAIDGRIMDFDLPRDWFENPEVFFRVDHDQQTAMVRELMKGTMKGLSFTDIRLGEAIRYIDTMIAMADQARERKIQDIIDNLEIQGEVQRRTAQ